MNIRTWATILPLTLMLMTMESCKSKQELTPKVRLETRIIKQKGPVGVGEAIASVDGKTVVSVELTFMVG